MITVTTTTVIPPTTTTTIPKTTIEKIDSEKKNPYQNRGQKLFFFTEIWSKNRGNFYKKMHGPPFLISILINQIKLVNVLYDTSCLFFGIQNWKFITKYGLKLMKTIFRNIKLYDGLTNGVCYEMFNTILTPNVYKFDFQKWKSKTRFKKTNEIGLHETVKTLNVKPKIKFKTIIPEKYWDF